MSVQAKVEEIIADALYLDADEVTPEASLMKDLGAESIDFLDIVFRLEKEFNIKIPRGELEKKARGDLTDEQFAVDGVLTEQGISQLRQALPEAGAKVTDGFKMRDIPTLFTVQTFTNMVAERVGSEGVASAPAASKDASAST